MGFISALTSLKFFWRIWSVLSVSALLGGCFILYSRLNILYALFWLAVSGVLLAYQLLIFRRNLAFNVSMNTGQALAGIGIANWVTLSRGIVIAMLAGFVAIPKPGGWLGWMPGILYSLVVIGDYLDGFLARRLRQETKLGEFFDTFLDGLGVFLGAFLLVLYGKAPWWYLMVGLARYLFLFGIWRRRKLGLPVYDLTYSPVRRALAGSQMGFIAVVLLPIFGPPVTTVASTLFMIPFLLNFLRDGLFVSGVRISLQFQLSWIVQWVPLILRAIVIASIVSLWLSGSTGLFIGDVILEGVMLLLLLFGIAGRITAILALLFSGYFLQFDLMNEVFWIILVCSSLLFFTGSGRLSLWKPEDTLIYKRAGERK